MHKEVLKELAAGLVTTIREHVTRRLEPILAHQAAAAAVAGAHEREIARLEERIAAFEAKNIRRIA